MLAGKKRKRRKVATKVMEVDNLVSGRKFLN